MWVRGLKQVQAHEFAHALLVAPHVGAWIETLEQALSCRSNFVAPHVGAWIETSRAMNYQLPKRSRTPCGCVD